MGTSIKSRRTDNQQSQQSPVTLPKRMLLRQTSGDCDSVEHSFKEKLSVQSQLNDKEKKELEVFELLEGATLHSSFSRFLIFNQHNWKKKFKIINNRKGIPPNWIVKLK